MASKARLNSQLGACTRTLNAEIRKTIIAVKAVDTGLMRNTTKTKIAFDFTREVFTISTIKTTFYYKFVDKGTIYIKPRNITEKTLAKDNVQKALDKVFKVYIDYMIDREFEVFKIK